MSIRPLPRYAILAVLSLLVTPGREGQRARHSPVAPLAKGAWASRGPGGGGALYSPSISPFDTNEIFLMTDMTGVFQTSDFGASWKTLDFRQIEGDPLGRVEFTSDRAVLYALSARGERRVLEKSADGGATFAVLPSSDLLDDPRYLFVDPARSDTFVTADRSAIHLSRDGGRSLARAYDCGAPGCVLGGAFFDGDTVYVGTSDGVLVARGDRPRLEAEPRGGIPTGERIVSFAGGGRGADARMFAVTYRANGGAVESGMTAGDPTTYGGIYVLDPGADRWLRRTSGMDAGARLGIVAMARTDSKTAYAAGKDSRTDNPVVYRTTNGGERWESALLTAENANVETGWAGDGGDRSWEFGEVALGLAVAPTDPARVVVTDLGSAHVTRDEGRTWQAVYVAPADRNPRGRPASKGLAYATSGIEPTSAWAMAWPRPGVVFADFSDIQGARSSDGGETWRVGVVGLGANTNTTYDAVLDPGSGALYVATSSVHDLYQSPYLQDARIDGGRGGVLVSTNAGESFEPLYDFGHPVVWVALDPTNPRRLYASVVHSRDGGIYALTLSGPSSLADAPTRLPVPPRTRGHPYTFRVLHDGAIVASYSGHREATVKGKRGPFTASSGVFVLRAGASAWDDVSLPAMEYWTKDVVVDPHDPSESTWYVGVFDHGAGDDDGGLYRTRDRGRRWERISRERRVESCTVHPTDPSVLYMSTETDGLFITKNLDDPAPTFAPVLEYPFRQPLRLFFNPGNPHELWATSFGGGLRATLVE